ncbi:MAG: cycloartenol synthase, partial [Planctomycetota bacterium]
RALNAYDQPIIETPNQGDVDWRLAFIENAAALQSEDGSWSGNEKWREDDPVMVTAYMMIALHEVLEDLEQFPAE